MKERNFSFQKYRKKKKKKIKSLLPRIPPKTDNSRHFVNASSTASTFPVMLSFV